LPALSPLNPFKNIVGSNERMIYLIIRGHSRRKLTGEFVTTHDAIADIIRESLSVKQAILNDSGLIQTIAMLGEEMSRALHAGRKVIFLGMAEVRLTHSTWRQNSLAGSYASGELCRP
jgi:hypothetical protein